MFPTDFPFDRKYAFILPGNHRFFAGTIDQFGLIWFRKHRKWVSPKNDAETPMEIKELAMEMNIRWSVNSDKIRRL